MIVRKTLLLILVVLFLSLSARAQYVDRILRPCFSGAVPYVQVVTTSTGDIAMTTCTGGSVTVNGAPIGGGGGTPGAPTTSIQFNSSGAFGGSSSLTWVPPSLRIGTTGGGGGNAQLILNSNTPSGSVTIRPLNSAFTAWTLTLPPDDGNAGEFLQTDGAGATTWAAAGGGSGITSINGLTNASQTFNVNPSSVALTFTEAGSTHTLGIPDASLTQRGFISAGAQLLAGPKIFRVSGSPQVQVEDTSSPTAQSAVAFNTSTGSKWAVGNSLLGTVNDFFVYDLQDFTLRQVWQHSGPVSFSSNAVLCFSSSGDAGNTCDTGIARNAAGVVEVNNGTAGTLQDITLRGATAVTVKATSTLQTGVFTVATLPTCNGAAEGTHAGVSDALAPAFLVAVAGGGAVHTSVYCNGTTWVAN